MEERKHTSSAYTKDTQDAFLCPSLLSPYLADFSSWICSIHGHRERNFSVGKLLSETSVREHFQEYVQEATFRSIIHPCFKVQFLWNMVFNCSPWLKVAERGREVWEEKKILLILFVSSNLLCQGKCFWNGNLFSYDPEIAIWGKHVSPYSSYAFWSPSVIPESFNFVKSTTIITTNNSVKCNM